MSTVTNKLNLFKHDTNNDEDLNSNFDIDKALNENWDKIDQFAVNMDNNKQNKVSGKGLSSNDYTTAEKTKLGNIATGAQVNVLEGLTLEGKTLPISSKKIEIKDSEVTNARKSSVDSKTYANVAERLNNIDNKIDNIKVTRGYIFTARRKKTNNSSTEWEAYHDRIGLNVNATLNGNINVVNELYNYAPYNAIRICNYDIVTKKVTAWFGEPNFKFDGSNGDVYVYIPITYIREWEDDDYYYISISTVARSGYTEYKDFFISKYMVGLVNGKLRSYSGIVPAHDKTIGQFRALAKELGNEFSLLDYRYFIIYDLIIVMFLSNNTQAKLGNGVVNQQLSGKALVEEKNVNRIIVANADRFYVGRTCNIGNDWWNASVTTDRNITKIEDYINGNIIGKAIYFDGDPVNITTANVIWGCGQASGQCDKLGMTCGCLINDGTHSNVALGIENITGGNMWQFVDGLVNYNGTLWYCTDHSKYADGVHTNPYKQLGYALSKSEGWGKNTGYDADIPLLKFPKEVGGSSGTYLADYYYVNTNGTFLALVGGCFSSGAGAGASYWSFNFAFSLSDFSVGSRLLIDNQ